MEARDYTIRDYHDRDYKDVIALWEASGLSNRARGDNELTIRETLALGGRLLLLWMSDRLAGTSWITTDGRRLYLHHFGIHPDFRGRGLSHPLVKASLAIAKERNMQIKLEVHRTNAAAISLYLKYGFGYLGDYDVYIIRDVTAL